MSALSAWSFDSRTGADRGMSVLRRLSSEQLVNPSDAAIVEWPHGDDCPSTRAASELVGVGAFGERFWATLAAELFGDAREASIGVSADFVATAQALARPGASMILVVSSPAAAAAIDETLGPLCAGRARTAFGPTEEARLRATFVVQRS